MPNVDRQRKWYIPSASINDELLTSRRSPDGFRGSVGYDTRLGLATEYRKGKGTSFYFTLPAK
jgi:hypothetical protein